MISSPTVMGQYIERGCRDLVSSLRRKAKGILALLRDSVMGGSDTPLAQDSLPLPFKSLHRGLTNPDVRQSKP